MPFHGVNPQKKTQFGKELLVGQRESCEPLFNNKLKQQILKARYIVAEDIEGNLHKCRQKNLKQLKKIISEKSAPK